MSKFRLAAHQLARRLWSLPRALAGGLRQRRARLAGEEREAERLDRIRNPAKYLGK